MRFRCCLPMLAMATALTCTARAQDAATTAEAAVTAAASAPSSKPVITGLFDFYFLYQFSNPPQHTLLGPGRLYYDAHAKTPTLALAELNVTKAPTPGGFGYKATFMAGDDADLNHGGGPVSATAIGGTDTREGAYKNIQQLFASYQTTSGYTVDLGKFYTPLGYEVTEATGNFNYSHSEVFNIEPIYHAGIRVTTPSYNGVTLAGYVVNSLFNTSRAGLYDDNGAKAYIGQATYAKGPLTLIEGFGTSKDKLNLTNGQKTFLNDFTAVYAVDPKTTLAFNTDYRKDKKTDTVDGAKYFAWAAYAKRAFTPKTAGALRYSRLETKSDPVDGASAKVKPWEATATYEYKVTPAFTTRLEYRHDAANVALYVDGDGAVSKKKDDTVLVAGLYTF
ncbi:MAG TPA: outer membrane beta-barrel protein [Armatimonadota bacterium]